MKKEKIPEELIRELDINEKEDIEKKFKIQPRIEPHQIKLPIPRPLVRNLDLETRWKDKKKLVLVYDDTSEELRYKI